MVWHADINNLTVDFYNRCTTANPRSGSMKPFSIPLIGNQFWYPTG